MGTGEENTKAVLCARPTKDVKGRKKRLIKQKVNLFCLFGSKR